MAGVVSKIRFIGVGALVGEWFLFGQCVRLAGRVCKNDLAAAECVRTR